MKVECPNCKKKFKAPDEYEGREAKCPECKKNFVLKVYSSESTHPDLPKVETNHKPQKQLKHCANCERVIGNLEQIYSFNNENVCSSCFATIASPANKSQGIRINRDQACLICGLAGATLLFIGVFLPVLRMPIMGSLNYFRNGEGDGVIIITIAVVSAIFTILKKYAVLWFTGIGSLGVMAYTFIVFRKGLADAKRSVSDDLAGNPFAGIGEAIILSVQIEWGWAVLILGGIFTIAAAAIAQSSNINKIAEQ